MTIVAGLNKELFAKLPPQQSIITTLESLGSFEDAELKKKQYAIYAPSTPILRDVSPDGSN